MKTIITIMMMDQILTQIQHKYRYHEIYKHQAKHQLVKVLIQLFHVLFVIIHKCAMSIVIIMKTLNNIQHHVLLFVMDVFGDKLCFIFFRVFSVEMSVFLAIVRCVSFSCFLKCWCHYR